MSPLLRIPFGILVMIAGFYMVKKTDVLMAWFGEVPFAEKTFGAGGSWFFYKLIGVLVALVGIFIATNVISNILQSIAGVLTNT